METEGGAWESKEGCLNRWMGVRGSAVPLHGQHAPGVSQQEGESPHLKKEQKRRKIDKSRKKVVKRGEACVTTVKLQV